MENSKNIEVELRSRFTKQKYDQLHLFLKANAEDLSGTMGRFSFTGLLAKKVIYTNIYLCRGNQDYFCQKATIT